MDGARRKRPREKPAEIAAAVGVVLAGAALIVAIVLMDPRWQRISASWRQLSVTGLRPPAIRLDTLQVQPPAVVSSAPAARLAPEPAPSQPVPVRPARAEPTPPAISSASRAPSDTTQVMANLLVSQLGQDPAWRTAMANAYAHAADSPEHAYWRGVAAVIRDGGLRPRQ